MEDSERQGLLQNLLTPARRRRLLHRNNARTRRHNMTPEQREVQNRQRRERRHLREDQSRTLPNYVNTHATLNHGVSSTSTHYPTMTCAVVPTTNDGSRTLNDIGIPHSTFYRSESSTSTHTATTTRAIVPTTKDRSRTLNDIEVPQSTFQRGESSTSTRTASTTHVATQTQTAKASLTIASGTTCVIDESLDATCQALKQNDRPPDREPSSHKGAPTVSKIVRVSQKKTRARMKPSSICPNPLVKAAAFAAGGRIATPPTAASLFKAARSKSTVTIAATAATLSSPSSSGTAPITAAVCSPHAVDPKFPHPSTSKLCDVPGCAGKAPCQRRPAILRRFAGR